MAVEVLRTNEDRALALAPTRDVRVVLAQAVEQAEHISNIIKQKNLAVSIHGRPHVRVEAWTALAQANGKRFDVVDKSYEGSRGEKDFTANACVGLRDIVTGEVVARAWASCSRRERNWIDRDDYAIESMAQTRAAGKVARLIYGWVVALAGYEGTPAEEISDERETLSAAKRVLPDDQKLIDDARKHFADDQVKAVAVRAFMKEHRFRDWKDFYARGGDQVEALIALYGVSTDFKDEPVK